MQAGLLLDNIINLKSESNNKKVIKKTLIRKNASDHNIHVNFETDGSSSLIIKDNHMTNYFEGNSKKN